jgi:hypothetical protein
MSNSEKTKKIDFFDPNDLIEFEAGTYEEVKNEKEDTEKIDDYPIKPAIEKNFNEDTYAQKIDKTSILRKREDYRGVLALVYTTSTFIIFFVVIVISVIDGMNRKVSIIENLKELLPLVSGIFLGSLGFVLGYYFKKDKDD